VSEKSTGIVKFFNSQKGFGFIVPDDGTKDLFVHMSNIAGSHQSLNEGDKVEYEKDHGRKGPEAKNVALI
jgi:cold shock protein